MSEYDPNPPFHAGLMKTAPAEVKTAMIELVSDFSRKAEKLAG
jgi:cyclohexyl-isocyanide hydratase